MSREYRNSPRIKTSRRNSGGGGSMVPGIMLGLLIGLLIAGGFMLWSNKNPTDTPNRDGWTTRNEASQAQPDAPEEIPAIGNETPKKPKPSSYDFYEVLQEGQPAGTREARTPAAKKPTPAVDTKPKPEPSPATTTAPIEPAGHTEPKPTPTATQTVTHPEAPKPKKPETPSTTASPQTAQTTETPKPKANKRYYLQAGSFSNPTQADDMKARLTMMGLDANVQSNVVGDKVRHKVKLGPFNSEEELQRAKAELSLQGVETQNSQ